MDEIQEIDLRRHRLDNMAPCAIYGVLGKRGTGKSVTAQYITSQLSDEGVPRFSVFCGNKDNMHDWARIVPPLYVHDKNISIIENIVKDQNSRVSDIRGPFEEQQRRLIHENPHHKFREFKVPMDLRMCIILDDVGSDKNFMNHKVIKDLCSNGRHYGIDLILILQYYTQLAPENRLQLDYPLIMKTFNEKAVANVHTEYVTTSCCSFKLFKCVLSSCTSQLGWCLLIDNKKCETELTKRVFCVKVPYPARRTYVGSEEYIEYSRQHYLSELRQKQHKKHQQNQVPSIDQVPSSDEEDEYEPARNSRRNHHRSNHQFSTVSLNQRSSLNMDVLNKGRHKFNTGKRGRDFHIRLPIG